MVTEPSNGNPRGSSRTAFPRVPGYAWLWLQRSRPVLGEVARRLTGSPPDVRFVESLARRFETDPFVRDVVVGVIADVAFGGRVPRHRPVGASWDRGLTWWAAALAGATPDEFEAQPPAAAQRRLFAAEDAGPLAPTLPQRPRRPPGEERRQLATALRRLLDTADGDAVPTAAVRDLLRRLQSGSLSSPDRRSG